MTVQTARSGNVVLQGIALVVLAVAALSIMDALVKWLSADYSTVQIMFFRSLFAFLPLAPLILKAGLSNALRTHSIGAHVVRSLAGLAAMACFFSAVAVMPLADAIAIAFSAPLFITILSLFILGEVVRARRWSAVALGFLGVLVMVRPGSGLFNTVALIPLGAAFFYAVAIVLVRKMTRTESNTAIVFYYTATTTVITGMALPFFWTTPKLFDLLLLVSVGILGGLGNLLMTMAYRQTEASVLAPFDYTTMLWGTC